VTNVPPPPLLGFNNNVRHRGRVFHIQTEDSGVRNPRIVTHLFADGGRIIKTTRTDYTSHLGRADMAVVVRNMMKEQHKAMFSALRAGALDPLLDGICGDTEAVLKPDLPPMSVPAPNLGKPPPMPQRASTGSNPNLRKVSSPAIGVAEVPIELEHVAAAALQAPASSGTQRAARAANATTTAGARKRPGSSPPNVAAAAASRPAARFAGAPPKAAQSIFGDTGVSEQSLDEVILSYLAEDLDTPSE
jgi:hypothetical protein